MSNHIAFFLSLPPPKLYRRGRPMCRPATPHPLFECKMQNYHPPLQFLNYISVLFQSVGFADTSIFNFPFSIFNSIFVAIALFITRYICRFCANCFKLIRRNRANCQFYYTPLSKIFNPNFPSFAPIISRRDDSRIAR